MHHAHITQVPQQPYAALDNQDPLQFHINQIIKLSKNKQLSTFKIAMSHFKKYIVDQYNARSLVNEGRFFFNDLLYAISLPKLNNDLQVYLIFIDAITNVDLGPKQVKAVRIARDLFSIPPSDNAFVWETFEKIIVWISKAAGPSSDSILARFRAMIFEWVIVSSPVYIIGSLNMTSLFFKHFPNALVACMDKVNSSILSALQHPLPQVRSAGCHTLEAALTLSGTANELHVQTLCVTISQYLVTSMDPQFTGFVEAVRSVIDAAPKFASVFTFADPPLHLIAVDKPTDASLQLVSLAYRCTPKLFKYEHITQMLNLYKKFINKKSPCRNTALKTLGEFAFLASLRLHTVHAEAVEALIQIILSVSLTSESAFALLSLLNPRSAKYQERIQGIFALKMDSLLVDGFSKFVNLWPDDAFDVRKALHPKFNEGITSNEPSRIILSLGALLDLKYSVDEITKRLMLQYAKLLVHQSKEVREKAVDFLLHFQYVDPGILERLIVFVAGESNDDLKLRVLNNLNLEAAGSVYISLLFSLAHDTNNEVSISAIRTLCSMECARETVQEIAKELLSQLKLQPTIDKIIIRELNTIVDSTDKYNIECAEDVIQCIIEFPYITAGSAYLIKKLILRGTKVRDYNLLINHVKANIKLHSSMNRINAALTLLLTAMNETSILDVLWNSDLSILTMLIELSLKIDDIKTKNLILVIITKIGVVDPKVVQPLLNVSRNQDNNPANSFRPLAESIDPKVSLTYVSVSTTLPLLMEIIGNDALVTLHPHAIEALLTVLKNYRTIGDDLASILVANIKSFLTNGGPSTISVILKNFASFLSGFGQKFASEIVPETVEVICKFWGRLQTSTFLRTTEWIATQLPDAFEPYVFRITKLFLASIPTVSPETANDIFSVFVSFGMLLPNVDYLVVPAFLQYIESHVDIPTVGDILVKLQNVLTYIKDNGDFSNEIVKTMLMVYQKNQEMRPRVINLLLTFIILFRNNVLFLLPEITQVFNLENDTYPNKILDCLYTGAEIPTALKNKFAPEPAPPQPKQSSQHFIMPKTLATTVPYEEPKFELPEDTWGTAEWEKWYDETIPLFIKTSPSRAISACYSLAEKHAHICSSLFPVAFAINILESKSHVLSLDLIRRVIIFKNVPLGIVRLFLSSIELLEISGAPIPVKFALLSKTSFKARQYHQALRYAEAVFETSPTNISTILVHVNQNLGLKEAANGVLRVLARDKQETDFSCNTYQFLGIGEDALRNYERKLAEFPNNQQLLINKMMCLEYLSRFKDLNDAAKGVSSKFSAVAAWGLGNIDEFKECMTQVPVGQDTCFLHAINCVLNKDLENAKSHIQTFMNYCAEQTFPIFTGDFERSYHNIAQATLGTELSEIVEILENRETEERVMKNWNFRIKQFATNEQAEYFDVLRIRSIYFSKEKMIPLWKEFLNRTVKLGQTQISQIVLEKLNPTDPETVFLKAELAYYSGKCNEMISGAEESLRGAEYGSPLYIKISETLGGVYLNENKLDEAIKHLGEAKDLCTTSYTIWNLWSKATWLAYEEGGSKDPKYLNESLTALLNALALDPPIAMHFILKVLSILFKHGNAELYEVFRGYLDKIAPQNIAGHMLQIIAKLGADAELDRILTDTILFIGEKHPTVVLQSVAAVYPYQADRREIIGKIVEILKSRQPKLVADTGLCRTELVRVASSLFEKWHYAIDEASRLFVHQNGKAAAAKLLLSLHRKTDNPPQSFLEVSFKSQYSGTLAKAERLTKEFLRNSDETAFNLAWQFYTAVYTGLHAQFQSIKNVVLEEASPLLAKFSSEYVSVPGTYDFNKPLVGVVNLDPVMQVFTSKQKPRCVCINGNDGRKYKFLLKANEDTRLDQRVMQLLTFVNTIMGAAKNCELTTYSILPLAPNVGLIGWVRDCTTVYDQLKEYRDMRKIPLNAEVNATLSMAPNFEQLNGDQREIAFKYGLSQTNGDDLKKILLINASDSSNWVARRILYTDSLALTSMVGYILGLGDRHPGNIMMGTKTAKLVHIDFGDCFEVAQHREHYPETVPFRLTRLFTKALEVAGVDGSLRQYSIDVMNLLRENKEPICGLLETFVYDPLLNVAASEKMCPGNRKPDKLVRRVADKLNGNDFPDKGHLAVDQQVDTLIAEATSTKNLCTMYKGWRPWW